MTSPLSQSQLSIYLACQGLRPEDGNYRQTPREYVDMIFDMLRSLGYLQMNA